MTTSTLNTTASAPLAGLRALLARLGDMLAGVASAAAFAREVEQLMALSDAELARRGLRRDEIVSRAAARHMGV